MGYELVGRVWDAELFAAYVKTVSLKWANSVTVHHTSSPSLSQRPKGWLIQHMRNLKDFYKRKLGWSAGPHLFTDEDQIFGMSSLWRRGVHARSFNARSIGIETLGNYDKEDPTTGRGLACWLTTAEATAILLKEMGLSVSTKTVKFHRDDPLTSKSCPGNKVSKEWFLQLVEKFMEPEEEPVKLTIDQRVARLEEIHGLK